MVTKNAFMISYDISEDKFRTKIANKLIAIGLERVQLSVFIGVVKIQKVNDFISFFQKEMALLKAKDALIVLPLTVGHLQQMKRIGGKTIDLGLLTNTKLTLII
jgi:CRISPR-associated endonuclease Cas2